MINGYIFKKGQRWETVAGWVTRPLMVSTKFGEDRLLCVTDSSIGYTKDFLVRPVSIYPEQPFELGAEVLVRDVRMEWEAPQKFLIMSSQGYIVTESQTGVNSWDKARLQMSREEVIEELKCLGDTELIQSAIYLLETQCKD